MEGETTKLARSAMAAEQTRKMRVETAYFVAQEEVDRLIRSLF